MQQWPSMLSRIRDKVRQQGWLGAIEQFIGSRHARHRPHPITSALTKLASRDRFTLVQIGAYTGESENDPLCTFLRLHFDPASSAYRPGALAVLIEPWPRHFARLVENYRTLTNIRFVNAAIVPESGPISFGALDMDAEELPPAIPSWATQLGSIRSQDRIGQVATAEHRPDLVDFLRAHTVTRTVPGLTLRHALELEAIDARTVDLIQIDAEGADYDILKSIEFGHMRPKYINYESMLLGKNRAAALRLMLLAGYLPYPHFPDTFCVRMGR